MRPVLAAAVALLAGPAPVVGASEPSADGATPFVLEEVAAEVGLDFVHFNGMSGELYMLEIIGAGVALLDYDGDGDLDVYVLQGRMLGPGKDLEDARFEPQSLPLRDRLYRNDSRLRADGTLELRFVEVTEAAGIEADGYGMGVAVGDASGNGCPDLYVTNFGTNQMWRNECDGTFTDTTADAPGAADARWSLGATLSDLDGDGRLDLFLVNYCDFTFERHRVCRSPAGAADYCSPLVYDAVPDRLLRNVGGGSFEDASARAGLLETYGIGMGIVAHDFNDNGLLDVYVANDQTPNQLWINQGDGTFRDEAVLAGCAVNLEGRPEASMGVAIGDYDASGRASIFLTHLVRETNTLYRNLGGGVFEDATLGTGLGPPSWEHTGFGTGFVDLDNDGLLDLVVVNGAVHTKEELARAGDPFPLHEPNQVFRNLGGGRFADATAELGAAFDHSEVSRGAAFGDVTNDGRLDFAVSNNAGPLRLHLNRTESGNRWLGFRLLDAATGADLSGTRIEVHRAGAPPLVRWSRTDGSYLSAQDPRVVVGLGPAPAVEKVRIVWPDGSTTELRGLELDRYHTVYRTPV